MFNKITAAPILGIANPKPWHGAIFICNDGNKGGVGKSSMIRLIAEWLASLGKKVILVDLDPTAAIQAKYSDNVRHRVNVATLIKDDAATLADASNLFNGVQYIYGMQMPSWEAMQGRPDWFRKLFYKLLNNPNADFVLFDTGAGDGDHTRLFPLLADIVITVAQPTLTSVEPAVDQQTKIYETYAQAQTTLPGPQHILIANHNTTDKPWSLNKMLESFEKIPATRPATIPPWEKATQRKTVITNALECPTIKDLPQYFNHPERKKPRELIAFLSRLSGFITTLPSERMISPLDRYYTLIEPELQKKEEAKKRVTKKG